MACNAHLDEFMRTFPHEALTFDDVSLITQYSDILPADADTHTRLTRHIRMSIPFVSAAMDTVTEAEMAIAMSMNGGIGVIHKNLDPAEQSEMVHQVKRYLNGLIDEPVTFRESDTLAKVKQDRKEKNFTFSGFPIIDAHDILVGLLTARDMKFARSDNTRISEVMTSDLITADPETTMEEAYEIMRKHRIGKLPLVKDGRLVALYSYHDVSALMEDMNPLYNRDENYCLRVAAAVGPRDQERVDMLAAAGTDAVVVDTAHGHSEGVIEMTKWCKKNHPGIDVIAGNIGTAEGARALLEAGADAVKVGIGPGSICTTRVVAGVGIPQITAIYDVASALQGEIPVIADGGVKYSGDVPKALVAGAESVMMGSALARTDESPGEKIIYEGRQYIIYRGMGSLDAMKQREGSRERYGLLNDRDEDLVPQGIEGMVPYAGSVERVLKQYCGGLRASMGYSGCRTVNELRECGKFVRVTSAGLREAHPHDVRITKEAPNYRS